MNKKGAFFSVFVFFVTFVTLISLAVILFNKQSSIEMEIGERQFEILESFERGEMALYYIDSSAKISAERAFFETAGGGGFDENSICGKYRNVTMWNCEEYEWGGSFPSISGVKDSYALRMEALLEKYLAFYSLDIIPSGNYFYSVSDDGSIEGHALSPLSIFSGDFHMSTISSPEENEINYDWIDGGEFLSQQAKQQAMKYSSLPYMWGGISPYPYHVTISEKEKGNPVFQGAYVPRRIPSGTERAGQPVQPGFDCSGFVWWNLRHMGLDVGRMTASSYYKWARDNGESVCDSNQGGEACWEEVDVLEENLKEGDLLFIDPCDSDPSRVVCHIGVYVGGGKIADSSGGRGTSVRDIPDSYLPGNSREIVAVYRLDFDNIDRIDDDAEYVEQQDFVYDPPSNKKDFVYSVDPSFSVDPGYDIEVYSKLRRDSLEFLEWVQNCQGIHGVENCVNNFVENHLNRGAEDNLKWSRDCADSETLFRHRFEDEMRSCFDAESNNCYCNITLPVDDIFDGLEYKFAIDSNPYAEEMVYHYVEETDSFNDFNLALREKKFVDNRMGFDLIKELFENLGCLDVFSSRNNPGYYLIFFESVIDGDPAYIVFSEAESNVNLLVGSAEEDDKKQYSYYEIFGHPDITGTSPLKPLFMDTPFLQSDVAIRRDALHDECLSDDKCLEKSPFDYMIDGLKGCTRPSRDDTLSFAHFDGEEGLVYEVPDSDYRAEVDYGRNVPGNLELEINSRQKEMDDNLFFVKTDERIAFISQSDLYSFFDYKAENEEYFDECSYEPKREYRFCVDTGEKIPFVEEEVLGWENLVIDFALYFPS